MKYLFLLIGLVVFGCRGTDKTKSEKIVIDMDQSFIMKQGDSVWHPHGKFVSDDTGDFRFGHLEIIDTSFVLKNWKPIAVVIVGADTSRYYNGDTLRLQACKPDTVIKVVYKNIQHADKVIFNQ